MQNVTRQRADELVYALVGQRTGIVREIARAPTIDGDAPLVHIGAEIANAHPEHADARMRAGGVGITRDEAVIAALCEAVERYAASSYPVPTLPLRTRRTLREHAISPCAFARYSPRQLRGSLSWLTPPTDETPLHWVEGRDLATDALCMVPAFAVYAPYIPQEGEPTIDVNLSTGLACATTLDEAIERATREVIERDALALLWFHGLTPPRFSGERVREFAQELLPTRDEVALFDIRTDLGIPIVFAYCTGTGPRGPLVSVGAACHPDPIFALRKAAIEASQDRVYVRLLLDEEPDWMPHQDFSNVTDFRYHARLYSGHQAHRLATKGLAFLAPSLVCESFQNASCSAREAVARAQRTGVYVDLTPPWASQLGLHVVRVLIPSLVPLHGHHAFRYAGHERLRDVARAIPQAARHHAFPQWPYPHAMP